MSKITELLLDEALAKQGMRAVMLKAFEADYPGLTEVLRQAMDMKALIVVAEVTSEADLATFMKEHILEELLANRLIITVSGSSSSGDPLDVPTTISAEGCTLMQTTSLGLYLNDIRVSNRLLANLFRRLRTAGSDAQRSHYSMVERLHLGYSEVGREGMAELQELLVSDDCKIKSMDLSFATVEAWPLTQVLKGNKSLTSLDVRHVQGLRSVYENIATQLLEDKSASSLGCMRCDAFDLRETDAVLNLKEEKLEATCVRLIAGLLKRNSNLEELDLTASDVEDTGVMALASALAVNTTLSKLTLTYNPGISDDAKDALRQAVAKYNPSICLML